MDPALRKLGARVSGVTTDYNLAAAEVLERYAKLLRGNSNMEDIGRELLPVVRLMAREFTPRPSAWLDEERDRV